MATREYRPGRTLLIFFICVGVLFGFAALGGTWKPRLGLDLEGGTRITLTAIGSDITADNLALSASIIDQRVNGSGVAEAAVATQGNRNVVVELPGTNSEKLVETVKRTAQLRFRIVAGQPLDGSAPTILDDDIDEDSSADDADPEEGDNKPAKKRKKSKKKPANSEDATAPRVGPATENAPDMDTDGEATTDADPDADQDDSSSRPPRDIDFVNQQIAWSENPDDEWVEKLIDYTCPAEGEAGADAADDPDEPLIACSYETDAQGNEQIAKFLLSPAVIEGTDLETAGSGIPQNGTTWAVQLEFKNAVHKIFGELTRALYSNGGQFAIVLDGNVISNAGVNQPILNGKAEISGTFTKDEAAQLANQLKFGALPIRFANPPTVETVGPSLAGNQLKAGLIAGGVGLLLVMFYCLWYYRALGLIVISSLFVSAAMIYAAILVLAQTAGFTMSLPGIAGVIVAVGITADSFVVYFERIRDDMRDGKSMRVAVESAWDRAKITVLVADSVSILAAVVLYIFAIGVVRGFAFALGISTAIDLIGFFFFTKPMMSIFARYKFFNTGHRFSGLSAKTIGADEITPSHVSPVGGRA